MVARLLWKKFGLKLVILIYVDITLPLRFEVLNDAKIVSVSIFYEVMVD